MTEEMDKKWDMGQILTEKELRDMTTDLSIKSEGMESKKCTIDVGIDPGSYNFQLYLINSTTKQKLPLTSD